MSGESDQRPGPPSTQPGGRPPAPGELALVQSFINTHYDLNVDHGAELFATPRSLKGWLVDHGLVGARVRIGGRDLERALVVREGLRAVARCNGGEAGGEREEPAGEALRLLNETAGGACVEVRFTAGGPRFVPPDRAGMSAAIGRLLAIVARAMIDQSWSALKVCPGEDCGWAFYDHSRNHTGRWCSMSICGGRAKARAHYHRRRFGE